MGKASVCVMAWQVSFLCQGIQLVSWKNMKSAAEKLLVAGGCSET